MQQMVAGARSVGKVLQKNDAGQMVVTGGLIRAETRGAVRLLWLEAPPANMLGADLRHGLMGALDAALADPGVAGIVLIGAGRGFSSGCDLAELGQAAQSPGVADLVRRVMSAPKPVIAALHGLVLGAAAELALAARGRVASPDLRFGLRDVLAGHLPMAGGTQTLPRLISAADALRLIGRAAMINATEAWAMGLVDSVTADDLAAAGVALALAPPPPDRTPGLRDGRAYQAAVIAARGVGAAGVLTARLIDCIEAAQLLPLAQGLEFEAEAAAEVAATPEAGALRHAMLAEMRMAADFVGGRPVDRIGLWGVGAVALVWPALHAGISVVFADDDREALVAALEKVALAQEAEVQAGRLSREARDAEWARLTPGVSPAAVAGIDLIVAAKPGAAGPVLHLGGEAAGPGLLLVAPAVAELQLHAGDRGFGQMAAATLRRMGVRLAITRAEPRAGVVRSLARAARAALEVMAAAGTSGASLGAGIAGLVKLPLPEAAGTMALPVADVRQRVLGAMAAEGARLLAAETVRRASDIDALCIAALGMPRSVGGPMFAADQRGLMVLRRDLALWADEHPIWTPHPLFDRLVSEGARLAELTT